MKLQSRYDVLLDGEPAGAVEVLPEPKVLYLPLQSRRFVFSDINVKEGQQVPRGQILANDPDNYSVPLLASRAGTVRLNSVQDHIVLENVAQEGEEPHDGREDGLHVSKGTDSLDVERQKLLTLGAWQFFYDAHTQSLPDPSGIPSAVIVSTLQLEPFAARGDVQIAKRLSAFTRGLEHLQSLLEYQPIYLVLTQENSALAKQVRDATRGYALCKIVQVPPRYPNDNFSLLARSLGLEYGPDKAVWAIRTEGVLAVDRALTLSKPCTVRIVSLGGPAVDSPIHLKAVPGYPVKEILDGRIQSGPIRVIDGGVFTGQAVNDNQMGLQCECTGLTVLAEQVDRELLGFARPGCDRISYSNCFTSALRKIFRERFTTGMRGEPRPCVTCGFCEEVCPAGIMPHLIHKTLYKGELEDVEQVRVDLCVGCGMCSFVCPSKIDLRDQFLKAQKAIREELHGQEVQI